MGSQQLRDNRMKRDKSKQKLSIIQNNLRDALGAWRLGYLFEFVFIQGLCQIAYCCGLAHYTQIISGSRAEQKYANALAAVVRLGHSYNLAGNSFKKKKTLDIYFFFSLCGYARLVSRLCCSFHSGCA